jgi:2-dehydro-3-deoxyphosphooctonate aldolase (KDO 8-P synthase)
MGHIINKFKEAGNDKILLCERGSSFGYNNLVVDPLNFGIMKKTGCPVVFDITHSLQIPGGRNDSADGRRQAVFQLMLAGMSQGIGGLFLESHPNPSQAKCDGPCALPIDKLEPFLLQAKAMDDLIKSLKPVTVD